MAVTESFPQPFGNVGLDDDHCDRFLALSAGLRRLLIFIAGTRSRGSLWLALEHHRVRSSCLALQVS
jgi:hypothetical protein